VHPLLISSLASAILAYRGRPCSRIAAVALAGKRRPSPVPQGRRGVPDGLQRVHRRDMRSLVGHPLQSVPLERELPNGLDVFAHGAHVHRDVVPIEGGESAAVTSAVSAFAFFPCAGNSSSEQRLRVVAHLGLAGGSADVLHCYR
jgi:hypothetical protein